MSSEKKRQFIINQLQGVARKEMDQRRATILCPYHNDTSPSGTVNLDLTASAPLGWYKCWSCPASKPWDELAVTLGLKKWRDEKKTADDYLDPSQFRSLVEEDTEEEDEGWDEDLAAMELTSLEDLAEKKWRSVPIPYLVKLGCKLAFHKEKNRHYIWMPVYIKGDLKGYVKAQLKKPKPYTVIEDGEEVVKKAPSYVNAPGKWSKEFGLMYYDYAARMIKRKGLNTVVLCEGPRDGIRLLRHGIPAISVLGALNWNDQKRFTLEGLGVENLILFMDGDKAGKNATKAIYASCKEHFNTRYMSLWKYEAGYDPFNCPVKFLNKVKAKLV